MVLFMVSPGSSDSSCSSAELPGRILAPDSTLTSVAETRTSKGMESNKRAGEQSARIRRPGAAGSQAGATQRPDHRPPPAPEQPGPTRPPPRTVALPLHHATSIVRFPLRTPGPSLAHSSPCMFQWSRRKSGQRKFDSGRCTGRIGPHLFPAGCRPIRVIAADTL
jgi:hypothetical protein